MSKEKTGVGPRARSDTLDFTVRRVALPSADTAYIDEGCGRPILLLHGAPLTSLGFAKVVEGLRQHCRVLAPDFPGFGCSTVRPGFKNTLREYARFVVDFCEALDLRDLTIFVNDSSGPIGLAAAAELGPQVAGLVIADTVPIPLVGRAAPVRFVLKRVVGSNLARWLNRRMNLLPWMVANIAPLHRRLPRRVRKAMTADFGRQAQRDRVIDLLSALGTDVDFLERTAKLASEKMVGTPTLILYGQFDPMRYVGGPGRFQKMFPNSEVVIVPYEEHFAILGSGHQVATAIRSWWTRLEAGRASSSAPVAARQAARTTLRA